jgi:hypothetical protein
MSGARQRATTSVKAAGANTARCADAAVQLRKAKKEVSLAKRRHTSAAASCDGAAADAAGGAASTDAAPGAAAAAAAASPGSGGSGGGGAPRIELLPEYLRGACARGRQL